MVVQNVPVQSVTKTSGGHYDAHGAGTESDPYKIEMFDRIRISMTTTTYGPTNINAEYDYSDPRSYNRCEMRTTLHYGNGDRTEVDTSMPTYKFDDVALNSYPANLGIQWNQAPPGNDLLLGKYARNLGDP